MQIRSNEVLYDLQLGDDWLTRMNESGRRVDRPATQVTHARQHGGDILGEQERSNSANVVFKTAPSRGHGPSISAAVRAGRSIA